MSERYFIFLYPEKGKIKSILDMIVYLFNPREKWPAHITVAGPFERKNNFWIREKFNPTVFAMNVGTFFAYGSPTVFIHVGFMGRQRVWKKPDFEGNPVPHLTLYDGKDMDFAIEIYNIVSKVRPSFSFQTSGLQVVTSIPGQYRADLRESVDLSLVQEFSGLTIDQVALIPPDERLKIAERLLSQMKPEFL